MYFCGLQKCIARAFSPMMNSTWFAMVQIVASLKFHEINQSNLILRMYVYVGSRHEHGWCQI